MTIGGPTVVVVGAGYEGKRRCYERLAALGARLVLVDEPGHWSESLADQIAGTHWLATSISGDPDVDAAVTLGALERSGVRPDGVLTFWEDRVCEAARVAAALGLPGNPPEAVDAARSKVRTRELSARLGLPTPAAWRVRSLDELFAAADDVGFPAVVKPEFGASAMGCVRVDGLESLPGVYKLVRAVVTPEHDTIFRAGGDLALMPSRKPRCAVVNAVVYAPATGRLADLPFTQVAPGGDLGVELDIFAETGQEVTGPDHTFATVLAELTLSGRNLRHARRRAAQVLRDPPRILPA